MHHCDPSGLGTILFWLHSLEMIWIRINALRSLGSNQRHLAHSFSLMHWHAPSGRNTIPFLLLFLGMIQIRVIEPELFGSWRIKITVNPSTLVHPVSLVHHDLRGLGPCSPILIQIIPKGRTFSINVGENYLMHERNSLSV